MAKGEILFKTSIRKVLDNKHAANLVEIRFRVGDHMMGIPGCFDLVNVTGYEKIYMGTRQPMKEKETDPWPKPIPQEYATILMPPQKGDSRETIASCFGPMPTDEPILYAVARSNKDLSVLIDVLRVVELDADEEELLRIHGDS